MSDYRIETKCIQSGYFYTRLMNPTNDAKYMPDGTCGVLTFGLKGGREAAAEMIDKLKLEQALL